jgi:5-methylcytosine-specific restriction endonuclease McrA
MDGNGARRRALRARVLAEETLCALCDQPVDKSLSHVPGKHGPKCTDPTCPGCSNHPKSPVVDEDIPRVRGGSPYDRSNCHLMHRDCNRWKSTMTLTEAKAKRAGRATTTSTPIAASPIW